MFLNLYPVMYELSGVAAALCIHYVSEEWSMAQGEVSERAEHRSVVSLI